MQCKKCGTSFREGTKYCPQCGAETEDTAPVSGAETDFDPADIEANKVMGGLAYFLFFLPLIACPNSRYARFHANQSLLLLIAGILAGILNSILSGILLALSWRLWFLVSAIGFLLWLPILVLGILGLVNGFSGKVKELPFIGKYRIIK